MNTIARTKAPPKEETCSLEDHFPTNGRGCSHALTSASLHDAISDLGGHIRDGTRAVRQEDSLCLGIGSDVAQGLEVLGDEQQFGDLLGAELLAAAVGDGLSQTVDDGPTLASDTLTLQLGGIGRCFSSLHDPNLLGFGGHNSRITKALLLVDLVHGLHHFPVWHHLGHQGLVDLETVVTHLYQQLLLDLVRDVVLLLKGLIQGHVWDRRSDHVRDVGVDLGMDVGQLVHGIDDIVGLHRLLYCHLGRDEDIVLGLGVHVDHQLVDSTGDGSEADATSTQIKAGEGQARVQHVVELAEVLDGIVLVLRNRNEAVGARKATAFLTLGHDD
mmetsp:Transcript_36718/g.79513  ORF Transcript_36718/g.79513 Transcript_36718/m.79513 type:complete len:329 (-) Transcript_36718:75-1061(-)